MEERNIHYGKDRYYSQRIYGDPGSFCGCVQPVLYHGDQKIDPTLLTELDTTGIEVPYGADGASVPEQKYRDVLKLLYAMTDGRTAYCVMGIENQAEIQYALPVRNGIYDFLQLSHQVSETARSHKQAMRETNSRIEQPNKPQMEEKPTDGEFLSGFWKTDRLVPVITLVIRIRQLGRTTLPERNVFKC